MKPPADRAREMRLAALLLVRLGATGLTGIYFVLLSSHR
jgi:hypothetical protein